MGILVLILTPLVTLQPATVNAQSSTSPPATQWQKLYGSGKTESVSNLIQTSDGGYAYFKEEIGSNVAPFPTPAIVQTDSNNQTQWILNLTYSGPENYDNGTIDFPFKVSSLIETSDGGLAGLGIAGSGLNGNVGYIYLVKIAPFLTPPSQSPLPTPLPSPTPAPTMVSVNEQILIIALIAVVVASSAVLLIYRRHRKTANLKQ